MALCLNLQVIAKNNQQQLVKFMAVHKFKVVRACVRLEIPAWA